jgi:hypothetical protein
MLPCAAGMRVDDRDGRADLPGSSGVGDQRRGVVAADKSAGTLNCSNAVRDHNECK